MNKKDRKLSVLILYDIQSTHVNTIFEHLLSFGRFSKHNIIYAAATQNLEAIDLNAFDVVIIHYCVRVCFESHLSTPYEKALINYKGLKVLFIQDEYDMTEIARCAIEKYGIRMVFTCVPDDHLEDIYPKNRFKDVDFHCNLTGYVPLNYLELKKYHSPLNEREYLIGYRGKELPFYYGSLGREKYIIAQRMKKICEDKNIKSNIAYDTESRIYGEEWYKFIAGCRATLGTESGSNIFDFYGDIKQNVEKELKKNPQVSYDEVFNKLLRKHEGKYRMNQLSPRIFESIALKTGLILFEGTYSQVIEPDVHYISLKKDFSNVDKVLTDLQDESKMEEMIERCYQDIIVSGKYTYEKFVAYCEELISNKLQSFTFKTTHNFKVSKTLDLRKGCATSKPLKLSDKQFLKKYNKYLNSNRWQLLFQPRTILKKVWRKYFS